MFGSVIDFTLLFCVSYVLILLFEKMTKKVDNMIEESRIRKNERVVEFYPIDPQTLTEINNEK